MEYQTTAKSTLHKLGITKCYSGYDYILYGIDLIMRDEMFLSSITKVLYIDIAKKYHTSHICVERNIRKVIEVIWKYADENQTLLIEIFGTGHLTRKPSNKEFFQFLYEYVLSKEQQDQFICPISHDVCIAYKNLFKN